MDNILMYKTYKALHHQMRLYKQYDRLFHRLKTVKKHSARYVREYKKVQYLGKLVEIGDVRLQVYKNLLF